MKLSGKKVVIIGGGSGMGLALAKLASREGATVVLGGRDEGKLQQACLEIGRNAETLTLDLGKEAQVAQALASVGAIDHLITTAAALTFAPVSDVTTEQVQAMLDSKFWGPLYASKFAAPYLAKDGSVTFLSGAAAYRPEPGATVVAALNAALEGMAMGLALELKPVRVNVVSPGVVDSPTWAFLSDSQRKEMFEQVAEKLPAARVGAVEDIAHAVLMVMLNPFMTASVVHVDGGARVA